ncbi:hypothetical protein L486_00101 [Kwoniella mangroviensis CBS 10435]|uniref:Uncharacterized protein n=1 Tax=Kwoniella mangroviensis CBS 10435 TaxID=1331196 RepID=A0A1B9IY57_9TREE|nr:hypothetical protein L486_00101 [Kwoniella mangroviensis CBS 10435]
MAIEPGKWAGAEGGGEEESMKVETDKSGMKGGIRFRVYKSLLTCFDTNRDADGCNANEDGIRKKVESDIPPWRRYIGRVFLQFPSPIGEYTPKDEWDIYSRILSTTFLGFSDIPIGSDVEVIDLSKSTASESRSIDEMSFEIDLNPSRGLVGPGGEQGGDVLYDEPIREAVEVNSGRSNNQECWNCLSTGHAYLSCPHPKNHMMIRHSRDVFLYKKDYAMPEYVQPAFDMYLSMKVTEEEKLRRLELLDQFGLPTGTLSEILQDAISFIPPDDDIYEEGQEEEGYLIREKMEVKRRRKRWDWYDGMMRWGYPPGWITAKDPIQETRRRIELLEIFTKAFEYNKEEDDDDQLEIYGGDLGASPPGSSHDDVGSSSEDASESSSSGSTHDDNNDHGMVDMDIDDHEHNSDSVPVRLENVRELSINEFQPPSPISHPIKEPPPSPRPPASPCPPPPMDDRPPIPPFPPPPSPDMPLPPPPDDIPSPPPAPPAPPSPTSHPNPYLRQHYALQSQRKDFASPPTAPRNLNPHIYSPNELRRLENHSSHLGTQYQTPISQPRSGTDAVSHIPHSPVSHSLPSMPKAMRSFPTPRRWVKYHTDLFDSERLIPYFEGRPFPIGRY